VVQFAELKWFSRKEDFGVEEILSQLDEVKFTALDEEVHNF